jgi:enoyl-CoA hydratase
VSTTSATDDLDDSAHRDTDPAVLLVIKDDVAHIILNRPKKLNAINVAMLRGLRRAIDKIENDSNVRAVILCGAGTGFCAGGDLAEVGGLVQDPLAFSRFLDEWHETFNRIESCNVPTIAAVHGIALAGGFELLEVCDLVILASNAVIGDRHAQYGLFPAGGSTQRLPRLIGERHAKWLLLSGENLEPRQAVQCGFANEVVPTDQVLSRAVEMATLLSSRSSRASAAIKRAIEVGAGLDVFTALIAERPLALSHMASDDVAIGLNAFRSRIQPEFHISDERQETP